MQAYRFWLSAIGVGLLSCGGRITVGDPGDASLDHQSVGTGGGGGQGGSAGTSVVTTGGSAGAAGVTGASGGGGATGGTGGSGGSGAGSGKGGSGGSTTGTGGSGGIGGGGTGGVTTGKGGSGMAGRGGTGGAAGTGAAGGSAGIGGRDGSAGGGGVSVDAGQFRDVQCGIGYPTFIGFDTNVLHPSIIGVSPADPSVGAYGLGAIVPVGVTLRFEITLLAGSVWTLAAGGDFTAAAYDPVTRSQMFTSAADGRLLQRGIYLRGQGAARFDYYACGSTSITGSKTLDWGDNDASVRDASADGNGDASLD